MKAKLGFSETGTAWILASLPVHWIPHVMYGIFMADADAAIRDKDDAPLMAVAILAGADSVTDDKAFHPLDRSIIRTWTSRAFLGLFEDPSQTDATKRTP